MPFPWLHATNSAAFLARVPAERLEMHRREVRLRAGLLLRLGSSQEATTRHLRSYLAWEFEGLPRPSVLEEVDALVAEVYARSKV